jgi:hypothetical protein
LIWWGHCKPAGTGKSKHCKLLCMHALACCPMLMLSRWAPAIINIDRHISMQPWSHQLTN